MARTRHARVGRLPQAYGDEPRHGCLYRADRRLEPRPRGHPHLWGRRSASLRAPRGAALCLRATGRGAALPAAITRLLVSPLWATTGDARGDAFRPGRGGPRSGTGRWRFPTAGWRALALGASGRWRTRASPSRPRGLLGALEDGSSVGIELDVPLGPQRRASCPPAPTSTASSSTGPPSSWIALWRVRRPHPRLPWRPMFLDPTLEFPLKDPRNIEGSMRGVVQCIGRSLMAAHDRWVVESLLHPARQRLRARSPVPLVPLRRRARRHQHLARKCACFEHLNQRRQLLHEAHREEVSSRPNFGGARAIVGEDEDGSGAVLGPTLRAHSAQQFGQEPAREKERRKAREAGEVRAKERPKK